MNIQTLLAAQEGKTLEFKRNFSSPTDILKTEVAFANTAGGAILVGVEDRTRYVSGVENPLELEERVASLIDDSISPKVLPDIEINTLLMIVELQPARKSLKPTSMLLPGSGVEEA